MGWKKAMLSHRWNGRKAIRQRDRQKNVIGQIKEK